jgi:hypothetical protein
MLDIYHHFTVVKKKQHVFEAGSVSIIKQKCETYLLSPLDGSQALKQISSI